MIKFPRTRLSRARRRVIIITAAIVVALVVLLGLLSTFYTEVLWFDETGYQKVFWKSITTRVELGVVFGVLFAGLMLLNLWIVRKITNPQRMFSVPDQILERYRATLQPFMKWGVIGAAIIFGLFAGSGATVKWQQYLLFRHPSKFGSVDPVFHKDLGFYVFKLPFERFVFTWAFSSLVIITLIVAAGHYFMGGIRPQQRGERVAPEVRAHLSVLLGIIVLLKAWGYRLDQFNLLFSSRGPQVTGASYTDVHAQLPALKLLMIIAIVISVLFFVNARFKNWLLPIGGIGLLILTSIVAGGIWPAAVQRLSVTPNERIREHLYIQRNIDATRFAYGIQNVDVKPYTASGSLSGTAISQNQPTIQNIRLWDPGVLINQYVSLQRIKQYYEFLPAAADVDRYMFDGAERQVMLAAREISPGGLSSQAQTWLNTHLVYTHGYGVVASRVDRVTGEGQPEFIIQNIPPVGTDPSVPQINQPRIYYGEHQETNFVVVDTKQPELDYPQGDNFVQYTYDGSGGIRLNNFFKRAAFAWRFRDVNLLISGAITTDSRLMFRRVVPDRIQHIAPFIQLDSDPYIAIIDGRLKWIVDGYTSTAMMPYSQRINFGTASDQSVTGVGNYIRNSVKFVVDAKDGTIDSYAWDPTDPILQSWMTIFPNIFKPKSSMSPDLLAHVRYPEGLFKLQTYQYANYHMTAADDFYAKQDSWLIANDPTAVANNAGSQPSVPPYYVLMRLPGENRIDFVAVRPFTPVGRANLTAYMVAHSDPADYGHLTAYSFPRSDTTFGPEQVQARINQDQLVAQQITLWNQQNSKVIYGNILIIPIANTLLYVQPLYLQGQGAVIPELKRVVAVSGGNVKMGDTLAQALGAILGTQAPSTIEGGAGPSGKTLKDLIGEAIAADQRAQADLARGDFAAYGKDIAAERAALAEAAKAAGAAPSPSPSPS